MKGEGTRQTTNKSLTDYPKVSPIEGKTSGAIDPKYGCVCRASTIAGNTTGASHRRNNQGGDGHLANTIRKGLAEVKVVTCDMKNKVKPMPLEEREQQRGSQTELKHKRPHSPLGCRARPSGEFRPLTRVETVP